MMSEFNNDIENNDFYEEPIEEPNPDEKADWMEGQGYDRD